MNTPVQEELFLEAISDTLGYVRYHDRVFIHVRTTDEIYDRICDVVREIAHPSNDVTVKLTKVRPYGFFSRLKRTVLKYLKSIPDQVRYQIDKKNHEVSYSVYKIVTPKRFYTLDGFDNKPEFTCF